MFVCSQIQAQTQQVKVTLKNGVVVKGDLKELDPTSHITVKIAGVESRILMDSIDTIEELSQVSSNNNDDVATETIDTKQFGEYIIMDHSQYPESFDISIDGKNVKMVLVRGGTYNMGYNGRGSLGMKSEPVHQVTLSSYYISEDLITDEVVGKLQGKEKKNYKDKYHIDTWNNANQIVSMIATKTNKPFRMLTEAEWEYASLMPNADIILGKGKHLEWCSDYFGEYTPATQINPQGPDTGTEHVTRSYRIGKNKWDRKFYPKGFIEVEAYIRIAISAEAIK